MRMTTIALSLAIMPSIACLAAPRAVSAREDLPAGAGGVVDGTETIEEVGARLFEHVRRVASGEVPAKAEEHKHREFQFWAEQTVSL